MQSRGEKIATWVLIGVLVAVEMWLLGDGTPWYVRAYFGGLSGMAARGMVEVSVRAWREAGRR